MGMQQIIRDRASTMCVVICFKGGSLGLLASRVDEMQPQSTIFLSGQCKLGKLLGQSLVMSE